MRNAVYVAIVLAVMTVVLAGSTVAEGSGAFAIVDTRQGVVRYNVNTGESWLLDTEREPVWRPIREPAGEDAGARRGFRVQDVDWAMVSDRSGAAVGLVVRTAPSHGPFSVLEPDDIVTKLNGEAVRSSTDIRRLIRVAEGDDEKIMLTVLRDDEEKQIELKLEDDNRPPAPDPERN